jgi:hypothetical protein
VPLTIYYDDNILYSRSKLSERETETRKDRDPVEPSKAIHRASEQGETIMNEHECGCSQATSINELCPKCRADYEEYLTVMAMLRKSAANSEPAEVKHGDAA